MEITNLSPHFLVTQICWNLGIYKSTNAFAWLSYLTPLLTLLSRKRLKIESSINGVIHVDFPFERGKLTSAKSNSRSNYRRALILNRLTKLDQKYSARQVTSLMLRKIWLHTSFHSHEQQSSWFSRKFTSQEASNHLTAHVDCHPSDRTALVTLKFTNEFLPTNQPDTKRDLKRLVNQTYMGSALLFCFIERRNTSRL